MRWTLPNILTVLRLIAAPGVAFAFVTMARPWADWLALILFVSAAATDWLDGRLARAWGMESRFGAMLDPIADKAMVIIALAVLVGLFDPSFWVMAPAALILFREAFVSGLREFLGDTAGTLKVTNLAKWKTTAQMVAIAVLFSRGLFEHYFTVWSWGMGPEILAQVLAGETRDALGLRPIYSGFWTAHYAGITLLWLAAILTLVTGFDYLRKAWPYIKDDPVAPSREDVGDKDNA